MSKKIDRIRKLLCAASARQRLDDQDRMTVFMLCSVLDGRDIRKDFGITPKRGAPKKRTELRDQAIAAHYAYLIADAPTKTKQILAKVAAYWKLSQSSIQKICSEYHWWPKHQMKWADYPTFISTVAEPLRNKTKAIK